MADSLQACIQTTQGPITLALYDERVPFTVANFVNLATRGYYDGIKFHRVIDNFMVQCGCPLGTGTGGPGYTIADELVGINHDKPGILSMAKTAAPDSGGSQFFITHLPTPHLDNVHSVFGCVVSEQDQAVVNNIGSGDVMNSVTIHGDTAALLAKAADKIAEWNAVLDQKFPDLKPAS